MINVSDSGAYEIIFNLYRDISAVLPMFKNDLMSSVKFLNGSQSSFFHRSSSSPASLLQRVQCEDVSSLEIQMNVQ